MDNSPDLITLKYLKEAGISSGMHVLDAGCARGELTFQIGEIVGEKGKVVGLDIDDSYLAAANNRLKERNYNNIEFIKSDLNNPGFMEPCFDAVVGRRVLMYLRDPKKTVGLLCGYLKSGGALFFQEHDSILSSNSIVPMPLHDKVNRWIWDTVKSEGGNIHTGFHLWDIISHDSLTFKNIHAELVLQTPEQPLPFASIVKAMLPRILKNNIATSDEIDLDTLEDRINEERIAADSLYAREHAFYAWAKKK